METKNYTVEDVILQLIKYQVIPSIGIDAEGITYHDLETRAKSHLYLYDDGTVKGRYDYVNNVFENADTVDEVIMNLVHEFENCLHGRNFYSFFWMNLRETLCHDSKEVIKELTIN